MFIEGLRTDSLYVGASNLRVSQLLAGICFLGVVIFLVYDKIFREHDPEELYVRQVARRKAAEAAEAEKATPETAEAEPAETSLNPEKAEDSAPETEMAEDASEPMAETAPEENSEGNAEE